MSTNADPGGGLASRTTGLVGKLLQRGSGAGTKKTTEGDTSSPSDDADYTRNQGSGSPERGAAEKVDVEKRSIDSDDPSIPPLAGVADDDGKYETERREIWAYYA